MNKSKKRMIAVLAFVALFKTAEYIAAGCVHIEERSKQGRKQSVARMVKP